ncbi:NAD(P)/FAD-dependent oxidoreductase [Salipiger mangrovisoli]|uniref:FAD-binding oxidoreductase n=1 Tax=Salipiger mangrovisoli TaxID=2865933 RepID=A0ABR9XAJ0_9RHOB|nr:FAD-binding oxidoreductase [Salipiger mangrovisoli]MBE9640533.1 FAD-binding oxidoreductase [Salipiger mangrovisoli]
MDEFPRGNLWHHSAGEGFAAPPLDRDLDVDLAVIGGGFTGCAAALEAARRGASVALIEAHEIGHGGSGRNVGLVNAGLWLPPDAILAQLGETAGRRLIEVLGAAPAQVFGLIEREGISCEATRNGTLHLAHAPVGAADLASRHRQGTRVGAPVQLLDAAETTRRTGSTAFHGALLDPRAGTVQPLAYCRGLARAAVAAGARLHAGTPVKALSRAGGGWELRAGGHRLRAGAVLMATNAYHEAFTDPFRPSYVTVHYSQFATRPLGDAQRARILPGGEGCWDTALVMSSFRTDQAGRLILGAMGDAEGPGGWLHAGWARRKLAQVYPELAEQPFEHVWQGRIAMTSDHVPKVVRFGDAALAVFGYSGRGIAPGTVFGTAAAVALLEGRDDGLPIAPIDGYAERFTGLRRGYYEFGATLTHALKPRRLG